MFLELPDVLIVVLNVVVIPLCHLLPAWILTRASDRKFRPDSFVFRARRWEMEGRIYERFCAVRSWKDLLPDGASWLGGFPKKSLMGSDAAYLSAFRVETCRGELAHHVQIPFVLVTLVWNPWPLAAIIIMGYALLSNLPCIVAQRHTRHRLSRLLSQLEEKSRHKG